MNQPTIFNFQNNQVRVLDIDGSPWWVAKDIVETLGNTWVGGVSIRHVPTDCRMVYSVHTNRGYRDTHILSEEGLYFYLQRCDAPAARPFQEWIAKDVVPTIRKTGTFSLVEQASEPLLSADQVIAIGQRMKELEGQVAELEPKAEAYQALSEAPNAVSMGEAAKALGIGRQRLFDFCRQKAVIIQGQRVPYQSYIERGWFEVRTKPVWKGDSYEQVQVTLVTGKGLTGLAKMLGVTPDAGAIGGAS